MVATKRSEQVVARSRDLGEAHVIGEGSVAIAVRASVIVARDGEVTAWGGRLRPYRPLALSAGRYLLRVRGEDIGAVRLRAVHGAPGHEVAEFLGEGAPSAALGRLLAAGGLATAARPSPFPRLAGAVEPTIAGRLLGVCGRGLWRLLRLPLRLVTRRRRVGMLAHRRR